LKERGEFSHVVRSPVVYFINPAVFSPDSYRDSYSIPFEGKAGVCLTGVIKFINLRIRGYGK